MRRIVVISALAFVIAGCASQQGGGPQVRDLSQARQAVENSPQYTVKAGDTLYGIAWQHNLDYRQLAAMNNIDAPYQIRPGQTISLREGASMASASSQPATNNANSGGAVATGLNPQTASVASNDQELDWLLPDESAIERNQRLTAERDAAEAPEQDAGPSEGEPEVIAAAEPEPAAQPEPEVEPAAEPEPQPKRSIGSGLLMATSPVSLGRAIASLPGLISPVKRGNLLKRLALVLWFMRAAASGDMATSSFSSTTTNS